VEFDELVERYIDAWSRGDVDGVLALMHEGGAYYDAFWRETCVGSDLAMYLQGTIVEEPYSYQQVGDLIITGSGVVYRYSAHDQANSKYGEEIYSGAEVLTIRDGKILTVSDFYCNPERSALLEVAALDSKCHGEPKYATSGLSAIRFLHIKRRLSALMNRDDFSVNPMLTDEQLAGEVGCSVDELFHVVNINSRAELYSFLEQRRASYASDSSPLQEDN
jgi:ketosteroid isomerase-like protein